MIFAGLSDIASCFTALGLLPFSTKLTFATARFYRNDSVLFNNARHEFMWYPECSNESRKNEALQKLHFIVCNVLNKIPFKPQMTTIHF